MYKSYCKRSNCAILGRRTVSRAPSADFCSRKVGKALGIQHGFGDEWLKIGGLKGFVDGIMGNSSARFYEPYLTSGELGSWRQMMKPEGNMLRLLLLADSSGHGRKCMPSVTGRSITCSTSSSR